MGKELMIRYGIPFVTKERYRNHKKSFNNIQYRNNTELSKYIWKLKENNKNFKIKWSILSQSKVISAGEKYCNLCTNEKLFILHNDKHRTLNKRSELYSKCIHSRKFHAGNFKLPQQTSAI